MVLPHIYFLKPQEENPEWRDRVLLVQIAVPSRTDVPEYQVGCDAPAECSVQLGLLGSWASRSCVLCRTCFLQACCSARRPTAD